MVDGQFGLKAWKQHITSIPSQWSAIVNPHVKGFAPSTPKSHPWGMNKATEWKFGSIFYTFYLWALRNWNLMIFDLLTLPQGHQYDPMVKILLALCSTHHPLQFDMPHDYVLEKNFNPLGAPLRPQHPQVPTLGQDTGNRTKNLVWYIQYLLFVRTHTKIGIKIFEIDFVT